MGGTFTKVMFLRGQIPLNEDSSIGAYWQDDIWVLEEVLVDITLGSANSIDWLLTSYQRYCDLNGDSKYLLAKNILEVISALITRLYPSPTQVGDWYISSINVNPEHDVIHYTIEYRCGGR